MRWLTCVLVVLLALQLVNADSPQANSNEPLFQMQASMRARMLAAQAELENEANAAVDDMAAAASAEDEHHSIRSLIATEAEAVAEQKAEAAPTTGAKNGAKGTGANKPKAKSGTKKTKSKGKAKSGTTKKANAAAKKTTATTTKAKKKKHTKKKTTATKKAAVKPKPKVLAAKPANATATIKPPQGPKFNFTKVIERLNGTVTILKAKLKAKTSQHDALKLKLATKAATVAKAASASPASGSTASTSTVDTQSITLSYYVFGLIVAGSAVFGSILSFVLVKMCSSSNKSEYD